jgi:hypothetical protein
MRLVLFLLITVPFAIITYQSDSGTLDSVAYDCYRTASLNWWAHKPIYDLSIIKGFVYLPQAALIDTPFMLMPGRLGIILWRGFGWALYLTALWRFVAPLPRNWRLLAFVLAVPTGVASLANGQASLHLAGFMVHAMCDVQRARWWQATAWLMVGMAVKPLMLVLVLLLWPLHRPLWWRIPVGLALFFLAPWLTGPAAYVNAQYHDAWRKLSIAEKPDELFEDFRGMLSQLGWWMPTRLYAIVRGVGALATFGGAVWATRRLKEPWVSLAFLAGAGVYTTVLNPRTQSSTYVLAGPAAALAATWLFHEKRRGWAIAMLAVIACWCTSPRRGPAWTLNWLKPLSGIVFATLFVLAQRRSTATAAPSPASDRFRH